MNLTALARSFERIGARLEVAAEPTPPAGLALRRLAVDIRTGPAGERFALRLPGTVEVRTLHLNPADRHLLLLATDGEEKRKFLCGYDERHWFVAAVPEAAPVGTVPQAKQALKPSAVQALEARLGVPNSRRHRRKNAAFRRQGEWFFVPTPQLRVRPQELLRNEPHSRGRGKPHWAELCWRDGGEVVWVCGRHPNGITESAYRELMVRRPDARRWNWSQRQRNMRVFVRGRMRHPDHATINLPGWHEVLMNTENQAAAMASVAFLD